MLFGTDRAADATAVGGFGGERGRRLALGEATISIPPGHIAGELERPFSIFDIEAKEDPSKHIVLVGKPRLLTPEAFVREAASGDRGARALLFVHGYNTKFASGLYRTAQLAADFHIKGRVFHYSWPSGGALLRYDYDSESARQAQLYLRQFLNLIVKDAGVTHLTVIAHSKGNDLVLSVLDSLATEQGARVPGRFDELILASPDVDQDVAAQMLPRAALLFAGTTLYANDDDKALRISQKKAGNRRAGQLMADGFPMILPEIESIDATAASFAALSLDHDAYVDDPFLRADLQILLAKGTRPPDLRSPGRMLPRDSRRGRFWKLLPYGAGR